MLTRVQKQAAVDELRDRFGRATGVFIADYRGLSVDQVNLLRSKLRESNGDYEYHVVKNTLLRRATEGGEAAVLSGHFTGPTAVAFSYAEPVGLAKVLVDYSKANEAFEIKGGFMDGQPLETSDIATLATLPGLDELRGMLVGLLQAPATKVAAVLQAPASQIARLVEARRAKLEEAGGGA
jgi:large subunit ribosomal protein L10